MKITLILFFTSVFILNINQALWAQDFIYKHDGSIIKSTITMVDTMYVHYYQWPKRKGSILHKEYLINIDSVEFGVPKPIYKGNLARNAFYMHGGGNFGPGAGLGYSRIVLEGREGFLAINGEAGYSFRTPVFGFTMTGNYGAGRDYFEFGSGVSLAPNGFGTGRATYIFNPCLVGYRMQPRDNGFFMRIFGGVLLVHEAGWRGVFPVPTIGLSLGYAF